MILLMILLLLVELAPSDAINLSPSRSTTLSSQGRLEATGTTQNAEIMAKTFRSTLSEIQSQRGVPPSSDEKLPVNFSGSLFATLLTTERMMVSGLLPERAERLDFKDAPRQVSNGNH